MAFPLSPSNGQTAIMNGISYTYSSATNAWTRQIGPLFATPFMYQTTANGSSNTFTLPATPISANSLIVAANGVVQYDYTTSDTSLIFNFTPPNGTLIRVQALAMGMVSTVANTAVTAGTYGSANNIPVITVGSDGRLTSASNVAVSIPSGAYADGNNVMVLNNTVISSNVTLANNTGAISVGPISINANRTVTLSANARWVIL
jgi:hypothetical protein